MRSQAVSGGPGAPQSDLGPWISLALEVWRSPLEYYMDTNPAARLFILTFSPWYLG